MNCPKCHVRLSLEKFRGVEIDRCRICMGMWLDYDELDQIENTVMDDDDVKGSLMFRSFRGDLNCPTCDSDMQMFHYRAYNLEMDFCPNSHGFWLDNGEEKKVVALMKGRINDIKRSSNAEAEWGRMLRRFKSRSFADRMKGMFRR